MDHREFLRELTDETKRELTVKSDSAGIWHLVVHLIALAATTTGILLSLPFWPLLLMVQGVLLVFLFTLEHEATHRTPFRSIWLNDWTGRVVGFLLFLPFEWFRYFHLAHHRYTNIPGKDPELLTDSKPENWISWSKYVSGIPYWIGMVLQIKTSALGRASAPYLPEGALQRIAKEARIMCAGYLVAAVSLIFADMILWIWIIPLLLGQPFLRLYLLAEHGRCPQVANMFENTRTTFSNRLMRRLAWNMPYHAEHHAFPQVPFHKLPELHRLTVDNLKVTEPGYSHFTRGYVGAFGGNKKDK